MIMAALADGKLCVVDVSQLSGGQALVLSGLILRRIFDRNQEEFTAANPQTIPTIAVVEEAQAVLNERATAAEPYIQWVKEGRKYDLGAVLVTQQPGSIPNEILSQGDNWFLFHLLSAGDLSNVRAANAHFGQDLLSALLNEPIPGQGVFWSSVGGKQYPVPLRVLSFESRYSLLDPQYNQQQADTYAQKLRNRIGKMANLNRVGSKQEGTAAVLNTNGVKQEASDEPGDLLRALQIQATNEFKESPEFQRIQQPDGLAWGTIKACLKDRLPEDLDNRDDFAYRLVPKVLNDLFGPQDQSWETYTPEGRQTTWIRLITGP